ncbi:glutamate ABC transporter substrate binding protein [Gordonia araii NBRC 100433]|uniref:Glutamate ABC transporter substrate binding protein n=1 Tax=Gordonia araii NBRC 100433 TaxID=1073574 RepID=G7H0E8_9ACTN|nr:transporter substrate-binding domain-containing protein [Gordonia araii]NNG96913.1 transporter substrate-binding domain-containing protein [Gordonia araii NBRC 100433]GAB09323.1 glutamate ABC transporter substrate binding protein [Gordonia araii NBRC 100433]
MGRPVTSRPMRRAARILGAFVVLAACAGMLTACGSNPRNLLDSIRSGHVILGTKYDQPGLGLRDPTKDTIIGFDPSVSTFVVNHIADKLGVARPRITWRETPSAQREALISYGEVDMIAATYSISASRAEKVDFAGPYLINYQGLLVRGENSPVRTLGDLDNPDRILCSVTGSTPAQNVKRQLPGVQLQEFDSYSSCVEALSNDKVDALTTDEVILAGYAHFFPKYDMRVLSMTYPHDTCSPKGDFIPAGRPFSTERYGIGMAKGQPDAVAAVNEALRAMLAPRDGHPSRWEEALRGAIGDETVDQMIRRAAEPGSRFGFEPSPGDLSFLESTSTPCPTGMAR